MNQWEYVGILIHHWKVVDWTTITAFHNDEIRVGHHFIDVLRIAGLAGWEMTAAYPESDNIRFWFKRRIQH